MLPAQLLALVLSAAVALLPAAHAFSCHPKCKCIWRGGKKTAECPYAALTGLPDGIDEGLQVLNLTNNNVQVLPKNAFFSSNLVNVQKLYLSHCSIAHMDDRALFKVSNLIELDLSWNSLASVPSGAWIHVKHLRTLLLNGNPITVLPDNAFADLKELSALMMTECSLETISPGAFEGLSNLNVLKLDYNRLQTLSGKAMLPLKSLHGIALDGNQWRCDCDLRSFRAWLDKSKFAVYWPICQQPPRLKGKLWNAVSVEDLACAPIFLNTNPSALDSIVAQEHSNVTLECRVRADPLAAIEWYLKDVLITNNTEGVNAAQVFWVTQQVAGDREKLSWLTVTSVQERNAGAYTCVAKNSAGKAEHNYSLAVNRKTAITEVRASGSSSDVEMTEQARESTEQQQRSYRENPLIGMIIGIVVGAMAVLLVFGLVLWFCRRRGRRRSHPSTRKKRTEVVVNHKVVNHNDIGKEQLPSAEDTPDVKLLAVVNPVQKPPRLMMADSYNGLPSELEPLDPNQEMCTPSGVWILKDHEYSTDESVLSSVPSRVGTIDRRSIAGARSPIPVPMPVVPPPPDDLHFRLQNELSDTLRRTKGDRRPIIGDDSSDGHSSLYGGLETLRVRDLEGRVRGSVGPDLIDQLEDSRGLHQESPSPPPMPMGSHWGSSYDHPSAYYRTAPGTSYPQELPPSIPEATGDGTEV
ncbi:leucine-rich repeat-containing protein 24-like [Ornithodoros turicata]|uniref:leucine-rich repeat-containing protein 24-like n=1 Tax=Ornithodoros turicata TaxID=34597 RepID=UPI0031388345